MIADGCFLWKTTESESSRNIVKACFFHSSACMGKTYREWDWAYLFAALLSNGMAGASGSTQSAAGVPQSPLPYRA
jgi:hypothetical protein